MPEIDFGEHGGGVLEVERIEDAIDYVSQRIVEFRPGEQLDESEAWLKNVVTRWLQLLDELIARRDKAVFNDIEPSLDIKGFVEAVSLIRKDSKAGVALLSIREEFGETAGRYAATFASRGTKETFQLPNIKDGVIGIVAYAEAMVGTGELGRRTSQQAYKKLVKTIQEDVTEHRRQLLDYCENHEAKVGDLQHRLEEQMRLWNDWRSDIGEEIQAIRQQWSEEWTTTYNAFNEQLSIEAPVTLWNTRAKEHESKAQKMRRWVIRFGVGGTILALIFGAIALTLAHCLLGNPKADAGQFNTPELIFAASLSLFYLTLFFWLMRIVVRMYMTEHHLGIDAKSRAAMAETYLALTKRAAAEDQDRAIVLATLFRPVVDGIVKDDGLPAITPAAILAGFAGGRGPH